MAEKRSKKSAYESKYGGGWVTGRQYLAEMMCARKSQILDKKELPLKFWNNIVWQKEFKTQSMIASKLIESYTIETIFKVLRLPQAKNIYSLGAPWLKDMLEEEKKRAGRESIVENNKIEESKELINLPTRKQFGIKNKLLTNIKEIEEKIKKIKSEKENG